MKLKTIKQRSKKKKAQITSNTNERGAVTTDPMDIERAVRNIMNAYLHKFVNLD